MAKTLMWVLLLGMCAQPVLAKPAKTLTKPVEKPAEAPLPKDDLTLKRLVDSLRRAMMASQKAKEDPDLTVHLLNALAEASLTGVIHGHYALAGCGQALRTGGLGPDEAKAYGKDMTQNWQALSQDYALLAKNKAFEQELRNIFETLAQLTAKGAQAATHLASWAELPSDNGRARLFEAAVEEYRTRVKALVGGQK